MLRLVGKRNDEAGGSGDIFVTWIGWGKDVIGYSAAPYRF